MAVKKKNNPKNKENPKKTGKVRKINRIKIVLAELGLHQKDLVDRTGISRNSIQRHCNNTGQPTLHNLLKFAEALEVNIQDLLLPTPDKRKK
jgi:putative transcriptional regulator